MHPNSNARPRQLAAKKKLTQEDSQELQRIRRVLCIPQDTANEVRLQHLINTERLG